MRDGRMHQTTVRFSPDLWQALEAECARIGISAAQYVREAALARLSYTAGQRGEEEYSLALLHATEGGSSGLAPTHGRADPANVRDVQVSSEEQVRAASAVTAQGELVWRRAREVRARAEELRRMREESAWSRKP